MAKKDDELKKLREQAKLIGLDIDTLVDAIAEAAAKKISIPDLDSLAEKVYGKLASTISDKLDQATQVIVGQKVDTQAVITGVIQFLEPKIIEEINRLSSANAKAFVKELYSYVDEKIGKQFEAMTAQASGNGEKPGISNLGNMSVGNLLQSILANAEPIAHLISAVRGAGSPDQKIAEQLQTIFRWHGVLTKLESGKASAEELTKSLSEIAKPKE